MIFSVGEKVSYPCQGPCRVGPIVKRVVDGKTLEFYHLTLLEHGGGDLFVPLDKADSRGIRKLLEKSEIPGVFDRIDRAAASSTGWKARTRNNLILFASGSAFDLAEIVGSMSELGENRKLQPSDRRTLEKAKKLLVCEISEVMGETKNAVTETVEKVIERRNRKAAMLARRCDRMPLNLEDYADLSRPLSA